MPIKKSALLLILLSMCSIGLLVFSPGVTTPQPSPLPGGSTGCTPGGCCNQVSQVKTVLQRDFITRIILKPAA